MSRDKPSLDVEVHRDCLKTQENNKNKFPSAVEFHTSTKFIIFVQNNQNNIAPTVLFIF